MSTLRLPDDRYTIKTPKPSFKVRYVVRRQFPGNGTYGTQFGDAGLIINRLLNLGNDEQLIRIGYLEEYKRKDSFECGVCGNKFSSMEYRDSHHIKRHGRRRGPRIVNLEDLTEEQRQALKYQPEMSHKDKNPDYYASPMEMNIPDPVDIVAANDERKMETVAPLYMDKTKASRR